MCRYKRILPWKAQEGKGKKGFEKLKRKDSRDRWGEVMKLFKYYLEKKILVANIPLNPNRVS